MTTENVLFALISLILVLTGRGVFILTHVYLGLSQLQTEKNKDYQLVLKRYAGEGIILMGAITTISIALFLFAHEGVM
jgi:hypothetical protein